MRNTRKILVALLVLMTILVSLVAVAIPASAANIPAGTKLYLVPSANWNQSNARFAAYFFGSGESWVSMTKVAGQSNLYEVTVPTGSWTNVIFCRMNPSASANNWNNKWNQTSDLTFNGTSNCYTVKEGTWDKGGGTWSTYGSSCAHTNVGAAATCTTAQVCLDCGDPVVDALGHTYNSSHLCTRCNEQATFTVAGDGAHLGTEWDTGNVANDMTYADGAYTKVYTNVAAGSYKLKVVRDHDWGTAYPDQDKAYSVATAGSTVTVTLKGTTVDIKVEVPHEHTYFYPCDKVCMDCGELSNPDADHTIVHVDAVPATCEALGNIEYWYCSDCGYAWADEALTQQTNRMSIIVPMVDHNYVEGVCSACGAAAPCEHEFEENTWYHPELVAADCCHTGVAVFECTKCDYYYTEESPVDPEAHAFWGDREVITAANCATKTNGLEKVACANGCGQFSEVEVLYSEAHNWDVQKEVSATCTVDGEYYAVCTLCEEVESYTTEAQGHYNWYVSCGQTGVCMECGAEFTADPHTVDPCEGGMCLNCYEMIEALGHDYVEGVCSRCEAEDPDYVAPAAKEVEFTSSLVAVPAADKDAIAAGTTYVDGYFTIVGKVTTRWDANKGVYAIELDKKSNGSLSFTVTGNATIVVSFASTGGSNVSLIGLVDADGNAIVPTEGVEEVTGTSFITVTYTVTAGTYKVVNPSTERNTRVNSVKVINVAETPIEPETPAHVNTLVVGDTNKIVVSGDTLNAAGAPIEWVEFVVTEKAHYEFTGDTYAFIYNKMDLADWTACVCGFSGKADLEPGTYYICIGGVATGEFNIAVTMSAILEQVAVGDNKVVVSGNTLNAAGAPIEWVEFVVTEKAHYEFTGDTYAFIYNKMDLADFTACVCGFSGKADLEPGTYYICVGGVVAGEFNITVTMSAIEGGDEPVDPPVTPELPSLQLGDNTVVIDGSQTNLVGNAVAWYTFTPANAGVYKFACSDLTVYILTSQNMSDLGAYVGADGVAELEAGVQYFVLVGKDGVTGEFTVNVGDGATPVHKNTIVVGDNHYIISDTLLGIGYEFLEIKITEPGTYVITGGAPMTVYFFTVSGTLNTESPHVTNVNSVPEYVQSFEVTLTEAGTYWIGFRYDHVEDNREFDINISLKAESEQPEQPDEQPEQPAPEVELTLVQQIMKTLNELIAKITAWFKSFVAGLKK